MTFIIEISDEQYRQHKKAIVRLQDALSGLSDGLTKDERWRKNNPEKVAEYRKKTKLKKQGPVEQDDNAALDELLGEL